MAARSPDPRFPRAGDVMVDVRDGQEMRGKVVTATRLYAYVRFDTRIVPVSVDAVELRSRLQRVWRRRATVDQK